MSSIPSALLAFLVTQPPERRFGGDEIAWCHEEVNVRIVPLLAGPVEQSRQRPTLQQQCLDTGLPKRGEHLRRDSV